MGPPPCCKGGHWRPRSSKHEAPTLCSDRAVVGLILRPRSFARGRALSSQGAVDRAWTSFNIRADGARHHGTSRRLEGRRVHFLAHSRTDGAARPLESAPLDLRELLDERIERICRDAFHAALGQRATFLVH